MISEVLALYRQGTIAWSESTARDETAVVGDESIRLHEEDGAEALVNLLFGLRSHLVGATVAVPVARGQAGPVAVSWADGDSAEGNRIDLAEGGSVLVVVHNSTAGPVTLAIYSSPDVFNRYDDRNEEIPAGAIVAFGPYLAHGWTQFDAYIYVQPAAAGLRLAAIQIGG